MRAVIEKIGRYNDYTYVVMFLPLGHRCGYVALPKTHKYYGYNDMDIPLSVYGGITYASDTLDNRIDIDDVWWIGFDYAHLADGHDYKALEDYYGKEAAEKIKFMDATLNRTNYSVTTCEQVMDECINLIKQL